MLAGTGLVLFYFSKSTERDNLWHIFILISLLWVDQDIRCKQYIIELAALLGQPKGGQIRDEGGKVSTAVKEVGAVP